MRASMLPSVLPKPHDVRVAVFDLQTQKRVLRLRRPHSAPAFAARTGLTEAEAVLSQDCTLGAAVRQVASGGAQASR
jgi:hypothetical protein